MKKTMDLIHCIFCCNNLSTSEQPTQLLFQIQLSSSLLEGKREVLVYECINKRWNLELSHYSLKTIRPDTVLELILYRSTIEQILRI